MIRKVSTGLAVSLLALILIEGFLRLLWSGPPAAVDRSRALLGQLLMGSAELGWKLRPNFKGQWLDAFSRDVDARGYLSVDTTQVADMNHTKVAFIGDSNTFGFGVPTQASFVEVVDRNLDNVSTINLGVPAYSSAQGLILARAQLAQLKPAIAVISFNFNDRAYSPDGSDTPARFRSIYYRSDEYLPTRLSRSMEWSATFGQLRVWMQRSQIIRNPVQTFPETSLADLKSRVDQAEYRKNLSDLAVVCLAHHVRPVFLILGDNPILTRNLRAGVERLDAGDPAGAVPFLESAAVGDWGAIARKYLADAYRRLGYQGRADAVLRIPESTGAVDVAGETPVHLDRAYHTIMRDVARSLGVDVIDAASLLETVPEVFIDECHFNEQGHSAVGALVSDRLEKLLR